MSAQSLLSRDEVLGGLAGRGVKQASALLALIENRTAQSLAESHQAARRDTPTAAPAATAAYLAALAQVRTGSRQPTICDLERYATQWAALVPTTPARRATLAHLLGEKYRFSARVTSGIAAALGLAQPAVQQAYQQQYGQPLANIYVAQLSLNEQVRWRWARLAGWLENLSPFWTAFALTLTEIVGAGILALPIALASIGPLAGVAVIFVFGLINLLTLTGVVEAITRNGSIRYGSAYFGRLTHDYLGRAATLAFSLSLLVLNLLSLVAYYIGIATTLRAATGIPAMVWVVLLFGCALYVLRRQSLAATIASALVIGLLNIGLLLLLIVLTLPHVTLAHLTYVPLPLLQGQPWDASLLGLVFGTVLGAFFGHTSVGNMAKTVLRRDPSGRTLLWGNVAAMAVAMLLYALWVVAVNGALPAATLAHTTGTALIPLAGVVGPLVHWIGAVFIVLGMGMATVHYALALFNQVQEWLPVLPPGVTGYRQRLFGAKGRTWLGLLPVTLIFLLTLWLIWRGEESFTGPYSFMGVIVAPLLAGIFPLLLLLVSRQRGDYAPAVVWRWLGQPVVVVVIYLVFLSSVLVHGLWLWAEPLPRALALATSAGMLVLTWLILRRGVLQPTTVIELCALTGAVRRTHVQVVRQGEELATRVQIHKPGGQIAWVSAPGEIAPLSQLAAVRFDLPASPAQRLKVWVHQISSAGESLALPAQVLLTYSGRQEAFTLAGATDQVLAPLPNQPYQVEIHLGTNEKIGSRGAALDDARS